MSCDEEKIVQNPYHDITQTREEIIAKAQLVECTPIFGDEFTIQLDVDGPEALDFHLTQLRWFQEQLAFPIEAEQWKSRNGNWHIQVKTPNAIPTPERLLIQCLLGSDLKRGTSQFYSVEGRWR